MKTKFGRFLLLGMPLFFAACDTDSTDDATDPVAVETFEIAIGDSEPVAFSGSSMKIGDNTYQLSGSAGDDSGLSVTFMWQADEPTGTFSWDAVLETNNTGTWMLMSNSNLTKSYYSYEAEDGEINTNSTGSLVIEKFGNVDGYVEGTFEIDNSFFLEIIGSEVRKTNVKLVGSFKVKREL